MPSTVIPFMHHSSSRSHRANVSQGGDRISCQQGRRGLGKLLKNHFLQHIRLNVNETLCPSALAAKSYVLVTKSWWASSTKFVGLFISLRFNTPVYYGIESIHWMRIVPDGRCWGLCNVEETVRCGDGIHVVFSITTDLAQCVTCRL